MEQISLISLGVITIIIAIADLFGFLDHVGWLNRRVPKITLLILGILITFIVLKSQDSLTEINNKIQGSENNIISTINELQGVEVLRFKNVAELYDYVTNKLKTAEKRIDDITWGSRKDYRTEEERVAYNNYLKAMEEICQKKHITYREIASLSDSHYLQRSINLLKYYNYNLGYYDISNSNVPLISYIIIDSKEVIIGFYRVPTLSPEYEVFLSVKDPTILSLFNDYYETLWVGSIKLKEGSKINRNKLDSIESNLNINN